MCIPQAATLGRAVSGAVEGGGGGGGGGDGGGGEDGGSDEDWGDEWKAPHDDDAPDLEEEDVQEYELPQDPEDAFSEYMEAAQEPPFKTCTSLSAALAHCTCLCLCIYSICVHKLFCTLDKASV
jgi:hypothetical protein